MTDNAARNESQVAYHRRRAEELKTVRSPWEPVWTPCADFIEPTRLRLSSRNEGAISRDKILNAKATVSLRTLASGMHSGITSPARPWFRLATLDPDLKDYAPVKTYLADVEQRMREVFAGSNVYTAFHIGYGDLGLFGQSVGLLVEDENQTVRLQQLLHGRFWIARDENGRATTLYRTFRWSVARIVSRFGYAKVSQRIRGLYDQSKYEERFDIWHAVEPRLSRDPSKLDKKNKPFLSNYWEASETAGGMAGELLEESGFDENPIIAPPWELAGDDHYGLSPGQVALGDIKGLQLMTKRKWEAIDKKVRPPMTGPTSMRNNPASLLPGAVTYVDDPTGKGFRQAMDVNLDLSHLTVDIRGTEDAIDRFFFADLFLMLANMDGIQPRNTMEIAERKEEKLLQLGPVLENVYGGQLEPVIDRTYAIMIRNNMLPPPPPDLHNQPLKIEYISILAQAQKAVATGAVERGFAFAGQLAAVKPDVLDKLDADEAVDIYFDYLGVPPSIVVPDDKVAEVRKARLQQQQAAKNAEMMAAVAPAAKQGADAAAVLAGAQNNPGGAELLNRLGIG
ncbi:phage tail protein [Mesorhizobium sp. M4A.F.Ca.ET.020.02.1.1]|uniref:portal protein n=1 Tax=Mesorhizobium sp. M4A.F.Ca.ET.020.02.1.1 TaxID=2496652 RepID=UPI000FD56278|nr:portal protein [Mesorhizobium sp. M4A.F.Ca.ET.020.02.1.1]RVD42866.1 phage tail protein [Mesorhizobium sp. M4A.F.Ca.ET.020.02.1.1]